jgi:hypothetical protein
VEHTPAVNAIHPAKALVCVGRVLYGVPLLRRHDVVAEAETPVRAIGRRDANIQRALRLGSQAPQCFPEKLPD